MATATLKFNRFEIKSNDDDGKTVDLRGPGNPRIEYRESIFMPYVQITAYMVDSGDTSAADDGTMSRVGLLESIKCQGTESVWFAIEDEKGNRIDLQGDDDLRLATTSNVKQSFKSTTFVLTVVSKEAFDNTLLENRCKIKYSGKIAEIARAVVRNDLKSPKWSDMNTDETLNEYHEWGQERYPFEMLLDLQRLAIPNIATSSQDSAQGKTAGYLFFQTSNGYQFRSLDKLFETTDRSIKKFIENKKGDDKDKLPPSFEGKILWSRVGRSTDALSQFESGQMSTKIEVFDEVKKTWKVSELRSKITGNGIIAGQGLPLVNPDYRDADGNALPTAVERTSAATGQTVKRAETLEQQVRQTSVSNYNVEEIFQQAHQNYRQKMNMSIEIIIDADLSLNAGDLVYCEFEELSTKTTTTGSQKRDSGIYMIADLCHFGNVTQSYTGLHLVRDSYGAKSNDSPSFLQSPGDA